MEKSGLLHQIVKQKGFSGSSEISEATRQFLNGELAASNDLTREQLLLQLAELKKELKVSRWQGWK